MTFSPRAITILGLIQVAIIMGGFLIARTFRNLWDKSYGDFLNPKERISLLARMLQSSGPLLLVIPLAWIGLWFAQSRIGEHRAGSDKPAAVLGITITILLIVFVAIAVLQSIAALTPKMPMRQLGD